MSLQGRSFLETQTLSIETVLALFKKAETFRKENLFLNPGPQVVCFVFTEPSTRTHTSFKFACLRLGLRTIRLDGGSSSLQKGETLFDTIQNLVAMGPHLIVVRSGSSEKLDEISRSVQVPIVSAGEGVKDHPTQALLDAYTIHREFGTIQGRRVIIVGDLAHSRVARSNLHLLARMGAEVGVVGPEAWIASDQAVENIRKFDSIDAGLAWADVCMALRIQHERHGDTQGRENKLNYIHDFQINSERLKRFSKRGIILHPGPVNRDVELTSEVMDGPQSRILEQVTNGVFIRAALISEILGIPK